MQQEVNDLHELMYFFSCSSTIYRKVRHITGHLIPEAGFLKNSIPDVHY